MFKESEMIYKRSELMKIFTVSIVLLFLISGLSALTYGAPNLNHNGSTDFIKTIENSNSFNGLKEKNQLKTEIEGKSGINSNYENWNITNISYAYPYSVSLENVNTSYNSFILLPVVLKNFHKFTNIVQLISFNYNVLRFNGILNDVASENVNFTFSNVSNGIIRITGNGTFLFPFNPTILYYLNFSSLVKYDVNANVTIDYTLLSNIYDPFQCSAKIELTRGWTSIGPMNISQNISTYGYMAGTVPAIGYSPYDLNILYVASGRGGPWQGNIYQGQDVSGFGGMFRSDNFGKSWVSINNGLNSTEVNAIAVNPLNPNIVVISTGGIASTVGGGIYKTINGGKSWQETYPIGGNFLTYYNGNLYAASYHAILVSNNFGTSWSVVSYFSGIVTTMAITDNGSKIFVGINQYNYVSILMSTNGGKNYTIVGTFPGYYSVSQIIINPTNNSQMWALIAHGYTTHPNLFNSYDGGLNWNAVNDTAVNITYATVYGSGFQNGYVAEVPQAIAYDPDNGSIMYVVGPGYVYKSYDGGKHFIGLAGGVPSGYELYLGIAGQDNRVISIDPLNDSIVFKGSDQGLAVSFNGGYNWMPLNNRSASLIYTVAADGSNIFTVAQDFAPIFSNDFGKTWYEATGSEEGWASVDPYNSSIVIVESSDSFEVSNNGGKSFFAPYVSNVTAFGYTSKNVVCIAYSDNINKTIFIAESGGIFESNDFGKSWYLIPNSPKGVFAFAIDPIRQNILYASNFFHTYISMNRGINWSILNNESFNSLTVDPSNDSIVAGALYIGDYISYPAISFNQGENFKILKSAYSQFIGAVHTGLYPSFYNKSTKLNISSVDFFGASPQVFFHRAWNGTWLFYTTDNGLFVSYNLGNSWSSLDFNLPTRVISDIFFSSNGSVYISTYGQGVFYDPELLNISYNDVIPVLTGYSNGSIILNDVEYNEHGYFSLDLKYGENNISFNFKNSIENLKIFGNAGGVYFLNTSSNISEISVIANGIGQAQHFFIVIGNKIFSLNGGLNNISMPNGLYSYHVFTSSNDYSIYYPLNSSGIINASFMPNNLILNFFGNTNNNSEIISSNGLSWVATESSNNNYIVFAGGGIGYLNISTAMEYPGPSVNGTFYCSANDDNEFILGGGMLNGGALIIGYYPQNNTLINYTSLIPSSWSHRIGAQIESVQIINNGSIIFAGSGPNLIFLGEINGGKFFNLSNYLVNSINNPFPWTTTISISYIKNSNSLIIYGGCGSKSNIFSGLELLNLTTMDEIDLSQALPYGVSLNMPVWIPNGNFIASNNNSALILANLFGQQGYVAILKNEEIMDESSLFPSNVIFIRAAWNGHDYILAGLNGTSQTPVVYIFNPLTLSVTEINSTHLYNTGIIAGLVGINSTKFIVSTLNETIEGSYGVIHSRLVMFNVKPSKSLELSLKPRNIKIFINNELYSNNSFAYYSSFSKYCKLNLFLNGMSVLNRSILLNDFSTFYFNYSFLSKITFKEIGLPEGTNWSIEFNNETVKTTAQSIIFNEYYGNYSFKINKINGFHSNITYGEIYVYSPYYNVTIAFIPNIYKVTFFESGLPNGTSWSVTLNNITKTSTNATITISEPNGSYSYIISGISGYRANTYSGTINVNGNSVNVSINWTVITYSITIIENGIPNGTSWSATLTGTTFNGKYINITLSSTTNTITFNEPNGSYSYIIHLPSGYQSNNVKGQVNVSGNSAIATIKAQQAIKPQQTTNYLSIGIIGVIIIIVISLGVTFLMRSKNKQKVMKQKEPPKQS